MKRRKFKRPTLEETLGTGTIEVKLSGEFSPTGTFTGFSFFQTSDYRIIEARDGSIMVQKRVKQTEGRLWWKKEVEVWSPCSSGGKPTFPLYAATYSTLEAAQEAVKRFERPEPKVLWP